MQCASVALPRDHAAGVGAATISIAVRRIPATKPRRGTLWLLQGGPGFSGTVSLKALAGELPTRVPDLDYVTLDHRGVGLSEKLTCPNEEKVTSPEGEIVSDAEWTKCTAKLGEREGGLDVFTTTASAKDLGALIEATREAGDQTFVWGGSYGTYLALRYLQIFPDQSDGVILEGIAPPGIGFDRFDGDLNEVAQKVFEACAADATCKEHLGSDPFATARDVLASLDRGHCAKLETSADAMRGFLGRLLYSEAVRGVAPVLIHRMRRCTDADVQAIVHLARLYVGEGGAVNPAIAAPPLKGAGEGYSKALQLHVSFTEFWDDTSPSVAVAEKEHAGLVIGTQTGVEFARLYKSWPRTPRDEYFGKLPDYKKPLLMLQGGLDPATPAKHAAMLERHFKAPNQTWALFPAAAHDPTGGTMMPNGESCALQLYTSFIRDPKRALDTSCIAEAQGPTFLSDSRHAKFLLGTDDAWE